MIIISLFALSYSFVSNTNQRDSVQKRVETLNNYVFSVEEDISRSLFVLGFRTIFIVEQDVLSPVWVPATNFTLVFQESFFNGSYKGTHQALTDGANFTYMVTTLNASAQKVNAIISLQNVSVYVTQEDPWNVKFVMKSRLIVQDVGNLVSWDKEFLTSADVPIRYFDDPIYLVNTNKFYSNKAIKTPYDPLSNPANLLNHVVNSHYINYSGAPSFIDRLEGKFTVTSIYGVESLVNTQKLSNEGFAVQAKSVRDYIYFSASNPKPICKVNLPGSPYFIWLDDAGLDIYGVRGISYGCIP